MLALEREPDGVGNKLYFPRVCGLGLLLALEESLIG